MILINGFEGQLNSSKILTVEGISDMEFVKPIDVPLSKSPKLILKKSVEIPELPFPLLGDPFLLIDFDLVPMKSTNYEIELFIFYLNVNQKLNS
jgi:hypothetical protein